MQSTTNSSQYIVEAQQMITLNHFEVAAWQTLEQERNSFTLLIYMWSNFISWFQIKQITEIMLAIKM